LAKPSFTYVSGMPGTRMSDTTRPMLLNEAATLLNISSQYRSLPSRVSLTPCAHVTSAAAPSLSFFFDFFFFFGLSSLPPPSPLRTVLTSLTPALDRISDGRSSAARNLADVPTARAT
jgi:hypothetical protein